MSIRLPARPSSAQSTQGEDGEGTEAERSAGAGRRGRRRRGRILSLGIATGVTLVFGVVVTFSGEDVPQLGSRDSLACPMGAEHDPNVTKVVYDVGVYRGVSPKVLLSAFEAGWVESRMQNLACGDRDSIGVFQQRPSQGWGTESDLMNVEYAATQFYDHAERAEDETPELSAGELAQRVQRSAFPERYDEAEQKARELIAGIERGLI